MNLSTIMKIKPAAAPSGYRRSLFATCLFLALSSTAFAQFADSSQRIEPIPTLGAEIFISDYKGAFPALPFDEAAITKTHFDRLTIWQANFQKGEQDESGAQWSIDKGSFQYAFASFSGKKLQQLTYYAPDMTRRRRLDFYYLQEGQLLSAIDEFLFDEKQEERLDNTQVYFYDGSGKPFQRTRSFPHEKQLRELCAFRFDEKGQLVQAKTSYTGKGSLLSTLQMMTQNKTLQTFERSAAEAQYNVFLNYSELTLRKSYTLKDERTIKELRTYGIDNKALTTELYHYDAEGKIVRIEQTLHSLPPILQADGSTKPVERVLHFAYNEYKLLERIISEQGESQTIFSFLYAQEQ